MATQQFFEFDNPESPSHGPQSSPLESLQSVPPPHSVPPRTLTLNSPSQSLVKSLQARLALGSSVAAHVTARVLVSRGITSAHQKHEQLDGGLADLPDPSCALNFDRATEMILSGVRAKARFGVVGDYDVDGLTAVALWNQTALEAGVDSHYWIPNRFTDGYGTSPRIAQAILATGVQIAIFFDHTPSPAIVEGLKAKGVECLVFDHHTLSSPIDAVVVNPKQAGCGLAQYAPSAAGLSFLLAQRLRERLRLPAPSTALVALGTVADMVPLDRKLNRIFVREGLPEIARGANVGLRQLLRRAGCFVDEVTSDTIAFTIAPQENSRGRMGDARSGVTLLTTQDEMQAYTLAGESEQSNQARKNKQVECVRESYRRVRALDGVPQVIVLMDEDNHGGINGLVAQAVASKWGRPAVIFSRYDSNTLVGSARNGYTRYDLTALWAHVMRDAPPGMIVKAGGHPAAAGITIREEFYSDFQRFICAAFQELYGAPLSQIPVVADHELTLKQLSARFLRELESQLGPFGQAFPAPRFLFRDLTVGSVSEWRSGLGCSVILEQGKSRVLGLIGLPEYEPDLRPGAVVDLVASATRELYRGEYRPQLSIIGYSVVSPAAQRELEQPNQLSGLATLTTPTHLTVRERPAREPAQKRRSSRPTNQERFETLKAELKRVRAEFDSRWIYPDLQNQVEDPLRPKDPAFWRTCWEEVTRELGLSIDTSQLEYRPAMIEFVRYAKDHGGNQFLAAPTGSGKTAVALTLASIRRSEGGRVLFLAPSVDIVRQSAAVTERLLGEEVTILDGETTPRATREVIHAAVNPSFICATPHANKNDIEAGLFGFQTEDLLIDDEAHHQSGKYPSVAVVEAARRAGATILLLSATPGQIERDGTWKKLEELKQKAGVQHIFPLNVPGNYPDISCQSTPPSPEMRQAQEHLLACAKRMRDGVLNFLNSSDMIELHKQARRILGVNSISLPSRPQINELAEQIRALPNEERWEVHSTLQAIAELSELHKILTHQGIGIFLLRCIERRFEVFAPTKTMGGSKLLAAPAHLRKVYRDSDVGKAYRALARGDATRFLTDSDFKDEIGNTVRAWWKSQQSKKNKSSNQGNSTSEKTDLIEVWKRLAQRQRASLFKETVRRVKQQVLANLAVLPYCDHPHEEYLVKMISKHRQKTLISVHQREHALFLSSRLSHRLAENGLQVVAITGDAQGARLGTHPRDRQAKLDAFNAGTLQVAIATQVLNEGVDLKNVQEGYVLDFDSSQRRDTQFRGRIGRRKWVGQGAGQVTYLCATQQDYNKVFQILRKEIEFQKMINGERAAILADVGLAPRSAETDTTPVLRIPGPPRLDDNAPPPF